MSSDPFGLSAAVPVVARGNSLVLAAPPSPAYAIPILGAAVARADDTKTRPVLVVAPEAGFEAWAKAAAAAAAAEGHGKRAAAGPSPARAIHHLAANRVDLLVTTLAVATELLRRSAIRLEELSTLVLVWPELELSDESFVPLFAELPKETQRIIVTTHPAGTATVVERYAWRAPLVGPLGDGAAAGSIARFRTVSASWEGRVAALGALADLGDLDEVTVWTADGSAAGAIREQLAAHGVAATLITGDTVGSGPIFFFDAPLPALLEQAEPASSALLVPPGAELYAARVIGKQDPITLPYAAEAAGQGMMADRRAIRTRIEAGPERGALATLAPLFDRWSAADVAVALQTLWLEARTRPPVSAPGPGLGSRFERRPKGAKVWASVGRKEGVTIGEWMGLLTLDLGIPRESLGKIETRETFTLIELTTEENARLAVEKLAGRTFKNRRITARLDRGREPKRPA